ncbi:zinc finger FYVE domain-containing protein 26-like, partial [Elysia marginata]
MKWQSKVTSTEVFQCTDIPSLLALFSHKRLKLLGHLHRMNDGRISKRMLDGELRGSYHPREKLQLNSRVFGSGPWKQLPLTSTPGKAMPPTANKGEPLLVLGSCTVPTPHHLSWLCLQELKNLSPQTSSEDKSVVSKLERDVDFQLTLSHLSEAKDSSIQELYVFFKEHVLKEKVITGDGKQKNESDFLCAATLNLLRKTMLTSPSLCDSVVKGLCVAEESTENRYNERLHGISIDCMNSLLDEAEERVKSKSRQADVDSLLQRTLEILSFYDPAPYWNYIQIRQLFTRLLTMATRGVSEVVTAESIVSVLCGRNSVYLMDEFCKIFHEVWLLAACNEQREKHSALTVDQQANLAVLTRLDRTLCWRDFFISCQKKSVHFFAEILVKAKNKKKAVKFNDDSSKFTNEPINVEQQKDITIFRSFCAIKNVMDALSFSVSKVDYELLNPVKIKSMVSGRRLCKTFLSYQSLSSSEGDDSSSPDLSSSVSASDKTRTEIKENSEQFFTLYEEMVTKKLRLTREHLSLIQPMAYRLEVMEDIFSLLFVTTADLSAEGSAIDMETDDDTDSKQSSLDNTGGDSLNMSGVSEEDGANVEDSLSEKAKMETRGNSQAVQPSSGSKTVQLSPSTGVEYDVPFVDMHPHVADTTPMSEPAKSAYFTLGDESLQQKETAAKHISPPRLPNRRRKRVASETQPSDDIVRFLANEYLTRDILSMLKDALSDFNMAKSSLSGKMLENRRDISGASRLKPAAVDPAIEEALQTSIVTSVQPASLTKRLTKLTQAVHEAWWRLQLVAHEAFPRVPGQLLTEPVYITDSEINFLPAYERWTCSAETGSSQMFSSWQAAAPPHEVPQSNIIPRMMASPESLLVLSLIKGNIAQAADVIKLFRLTDKSLETREVSFADLYNSSAENIWNLEVQSREQSQTPPKVGKRSLKALSKAAAVGVATASLSHIVEDLVSSPSVPPVPKPRSATARERYSDLFSLDPQSALLLDLLCTSCHTWQTCVNMLDIIKSKSRLLQQDPRLDKHSRSPGELYVKKAMGFSSSSLSPQQSPQSSVSSTANSPHSVTSSVALDPSPVAPPRNTDSALQNITGCSKLTWRLHDLLLIDDSIEGLTSHPNRRGHRLGLQNHLHTAQATLYPETQVKLDAALTVIRRAVDQVTQVLTGPKHGATLDISMDENVLSISPTSSLSGGGSLSGSKLSNSSGVSRTSSVKQSQERHPLHGAVKYLMFSMEKYMPGDGLAHAHLSRSGMAATPPAKNFLLSLYEHVKEMAHLVAECEGSTKDLTNNYFKVLSDGPVNVLGRLMFVKKMPPAKLEAVAERLSLNLTHTIVYSCCPKIPSKHPQPSPQLRTKLMLKQEGTCVMNVARQSSEACSTQNAAQAGELEAMYHPEVHVRTILSQALSAIQGLTEGLFDLQCAMKFVKTADYQTMTTAVHGLRDLDLDLLKTEEERICFLANLTNLMILHCNLHMLESNVSPDGEQVKLCSLAAADNLGYFCAFSYHVGQLGCVSVFDLMTNLCRDGLTPSSRWRKLMSCSKLTLSSEDPWHNYCLHGEARLIFVINQGCISSPPLQVLKPDSVQAQLSQAQKSYLSHTVSVSTEHERVTLPELLVWHENDFVQLDPSLTEIRYEALLKWVSQHINTEKHVQLQQLLSLDAASENTDTSVNKGLPFRITVESFDNTFAVAFNIKDVKASVDAATVAASSARSRGPSTVSTGSHKSQSSGQPTSKTVSSGDPVLRPSEYVGSLCSWSVAQPVYNLTPVTLEYVKQDSLLVATMVSLVCADNLDNIEQQFTDDHFQLTESNSTTASQSLSLARSYSTGLPLPHSSSDISLVDIRSYRYHRLMDDYPILMRHLLHYILPLASANNPQLLEGRDPILKFVTNEIDDQVKLCMFSLPGSRQFQGVVHNMANCLLEERKWLELLHILHTLPCQVVAEKLCLQTLQDHVLTCWALTEVKQPGFAPKIGDKLRCYFNPSLQARTVLSISSALSKDLCLDLLELCLNKLQKNAVIRKAVAARFEEVQIHAKISENARALRVKLSTKDLFMSNMSAEDKELSSLVEELTDWRQIATVTEKRPMDVITLLEKVGDFETAKEWACLHNMDSTYQSEIKKRQVMHLLREGRQPEMVKAFQELDTLREASEKTCLSVCKDIMAGLSNPHQIKFVVSFMLQYLTHCLPAEDLETLKLQRIGAKALMCIPCKLQKDYNHLITCPHLILEQLLMNMKSMASPAGGKADFSNRKSGGQKPGVGKEHSGKFIMPANPPSVQDWVPDNAASVCMVCQIEQFSMAPSVSLCVSILKQHSSRTESGRLILSICDMLSGYMVPISPGVPNPEIDYSLIISVIKQLLFQAKIGFQNTGDSGLVAECDTYLARVDLLRVMVGAYFQDLPTIKELTKIDSVRRLRDKLIADERLSLAMEVSTKCGIDPAGVWSAMGFASLQLGDFIGARDKFSHCLK